MAADIAGGVAAVSGNRLGREISLYLRQHARQPVAWQPWDDAALEQARREDRPILLSVGYSACHWCHVMAHESFDDEETARIMNQHFVNIKVDREERPDLDRIYQSAHLLLTGRPGGWPLTMFLLPQRQQAFFGGTYFPREPAMHLPGFKDLLLRVLQCYREQRPQVQTQAHSLNEHLGRFFADAPPAAPAQLDPAPLRAAAETLAAASDPRHGGFGGAPKFPMQPQLAFLLHGRWLAPAGESAGPHGLALEAALRTLRQMARGGIYDHLGGGFFRYAVDAAWQIPHFEKMLYDNAQLLSLYSEAWECRREDGFRDVVRATAEWLMRDMQDPAGGCYSSLDADDPERGEGAFYLWRREEAQKLLSPAEYEQFAACYGLDRAPNFEGAWHLSIHREPRELAAADGEPPAADKIEEIERSLAACRAKLCAHRRARPSHALDRKVLTAWNGMAIKGMATSARIFQQPSWQEAAERMLRYIRQHHWRDGALLRESGEEGPARLNGYLEDYALLIEGILALLECRWRAATLELAASLADAMLERFEDRERGGFFFTSHDHEQLVQRPKPYEDEALPAANGVAARVLLRLGALLGEPRYLQAAERTLAVCWPRLREAPQAYATLLLALHEQLRPAPLTILRGPEAELRRWQRACRGHTPGPVFCIPPAAGPLPAAIAGKAVPENAGEVAAYLCVGTSCRAPLFRLPELLTALSQLK